MTNRDEQLRDARAVLERITAYLSGGGLFNPEMALHDRVRDLLIDCRHHIQASERTVEELEQKLQGLNELTFTEQQLQAWLNHLNATAMNDFEQDTNAELCDKMKSFGAFIPNAGSELFATAIKRLEAITLEILPEQL